MQLNPFPTLPASHVVVYSQLLACPGHADEAIQRSSKHSCMSDKTQKQPTAKAACATFSTNNCLKCQLVCSVHSYRQRCVLLLCAWKTDFLKPSHICTHTCTHTHIYIHVHIYIYIYICSPKSKDDYHTVVYDEDSSDWAINGEHT